MDLFYIYYNTSIINELIINKLTSYPNNSQFLLFTLSEALRIANQKVDAATNELGATSDALLTLGGDIAQVIYIYIY